MCRCGRKRSVLKALALAGECLRAQSAFRLKMGLISATLT